MNIKVEKLGPQQMSRSPIERRSNSGCPLSRDMSTTLPPHRQSTSSLLSCSPVRGLGSCQAAERRSLLFLMPIRSAASQGNDTMGHFFSRFFFPSFASDGDTNAGEQRTAVDLNEIDLGIDGDDDGMDGVDDETLADTVTRGTATPLYETRVDGNLVEQAAARLGAEATPFQSPRTLAGSPAIVGAARRTRMLDDNVTMSTDEEERWDMPVSNAENLFSRRVLGDEDESLARQATPTRSAGTDEEEIL